MITTHPVLDRLLDNHPELAVAVREAFITAHGSVQVHVDNQHIIVPGMVLLAWHTILHNPHISVRKVDQLFTMVLLQGVSGGQRFCVAATFDGPAARELLSEGDATVTTLRHLQKAGAR